MKSIKLSKRNKELLKTHFEGSFDDMINQLLDLVEEDLPVVDLTNDKYTSIKISSGTEDRLLAYRLTPKESYQNIIVRCLYLAKYLNSIDD